MVDYVRATKFSLAQGDIYLNMEAGETVVIAVQGRGYLGRGQMAFSALKGDVEVSYSIERPEVIINQLRGQAFISNKKSMFEGTEYPAIPDVDSFTVWQEVKKEGNITRFQMPATAIRFKASSKATVILAGDF